MENDFLNNLNPEQKKAVLNTKGPMIILAGAGSGKTRVLTCKVIYLVLEKNINPENILLTTFTNKAAGEMKDRIRKFLQLKTAGLPTIATFHSLCAKILRIEGKHISISGNFVIYDEQDQLDAIKEAMKKIDISIKDYRPSSILTTISDAKNQLIGELEYQGFAKGHFQEIVAKIYPLYQKILTENNALDFDDLLLKTIFLFAKNQNILEKYQNRFRYILIDEYQDTNRVQYSLTKLLAGSPSAEQNICVVGDFCQSIYSWRGADFQNLSRFQKDFKNTKTFSLSQNYRSTQKILDAASAVVSNNTLHPILSLWTENKKGEDIVIYEAKNEHNEAEFIVHQVTELKFSEEKYSYSSIAVLYRTNAQSRILEEVFLHHAVPYVLIGGTRFYERKEIKDILAYLKFFDNPKDSVSYKRLEKIGKTRLNHFLEFQNSIKDSTNLDTIELLDKILKATNYLEIYDEKEEEDRQRLENIKELRSVAVEFPNLTQFLENVALIEQEYMPDNSTREKKKNAITMMTLHAAKGLEFPIVFIIGLEEGLFPHSRSLMDKSGLEEERRLCYVGMTRAKKKLFLTYAKRRLFFGQRTSNIISRFVLELPEKVISKKFSYLNSTDEAPDFL